MGKTVIGFTRKNLNFDYVLKALTFHQGRQVVIKIAEAKPALFDLLAFLAILGILLAMSFVCNFVGYTSTTKTSGSKSKKNI
jgi:hypothetical protein